MSFCHFKDPGPFDDVPEPWTVIKELGGKWEIVQGSCSGGHSHVKVILPNGRSEEGWNSACALNRLYPDGLPTEVSDG